MVAGSPRTQRAFALEHPWFAPKKLETRTHFPMLDIPDVVAREIESFVSGIFVPR